jgi:hypothetical protein
MTATHIKYLKSLEACPSAIEFASDYSSLSEAYAACTKPEWLFWLAGRTGIVTRQQIVLAACACARTALPYAKGPEALTAIETTEAWCRGEATIGQVRVAGAAAYAVADRADRADRAARSACAARAARAAGATADAADAAAGAAYAAADAGGNRSTMCDLIRAIIPCPPTG